MKELVGIAEQVAAQLIARKQTIAVAESSTGGLISASLLAVPGASAYFLGGAVVYTRDARRVLMDISDEGNEGLSLLVGALRKAAGRTDAPAASTATGACPKPAPPARPATATATPPAIAAWPSPAPRQR